MVDKAPQAFRTISEVADTLDVPAHVLRFWESRFTQIKPIKRGGGRRYYRPTDVNLIRGIQTLLYSDGLTIKGAQKVLREKGVRHVMALGSGDDLPPVEMRSSDDLAESVVAAFEDTASEPDNVEMPKEDAPAIEDAPLVDEMAEVAPHEDFGANFAIDAMESGLVDAEKADPVEPAAEIEAQPPEIDEDIDLAPSIDASPPADIEMPTPVETSEPAAHVYMPPPLPDALTPVPVDPSVDLKQLNEDDTLEPEVEDIIESPAAPDKTEEIRAIVRELERLRDQMKSV